MKILVTGANGYLGQGIVRKILDYGHIVIAADFSTENVDDRAVKKNCNLFEVNSPYEYFEQPDVLLHLAWRDGFVHNSEAHILDLPKHYLLVKQMANAGIKKIAVMGSMHEIGFYEGCIKEDTPCFPLNLYGISKNALRETVELITQEKEIIFQWLRGYYIVGNSQYGNSIFSKITATAAEGKKVFPFTMGRNQYDFISYEQFCEQVAAAVCQNEVVGVINICSGYPQRLADRVEQFIKDNNYEIKLNYGAFPDRAYDSKAVWGDNSKINQIMLESKYRKMKSDKEI